MVNQSVLSQSDQLNVKTVFPEEKCKAIQLQAETGTEVSRSLRLTVFKINGQGHRIGHYMYMCPIRNGLHDGAISLYICKIVEKDLLRFVSTISTYCSGDNRVGSF